MTLNVICCTFPQNFHLNSQTNKHLPACCVIINLNTYNTTPSELLIYPKPLRVFFPNQQQNLFLEKLCTITRLQSLNSLCLCLNLNEKHCQIKTKDKLRNQQRLGLATFRLPHNFVTSLISSKLTVVTFSAGLAPCLSRACRHML